MYLCIFHEHICTLFDRHLTIFLFFDLQDDRTPMSSGESGDESSGLDSPGPSGIGGGNQIQQLTHHNPREVYQNNAASAPRQPTLSLITTQQSQRKQSQQSQLHQQPQSKQTTHHHQNHQGQTQLSNEGTRETSLNSLNSVMYPAAALANVPQDVLLSLVQAGHLQVHQGEGDLFLLKLSIFEGKN